MTQAIMNILYIVMQLAFVALTVAIMVVVVRRLDRQLDRIDPPRKHPRPRKHAPRKSRVHIHQHPCELPSRDLPVLQFGPGGDYTRRVMPADLLSSPSPKPQAASPTQRPATTP